jgi:hypothetical protein
VREKVGAYCHPHIDAHQQDKEVDQMRKHLAIACFISFIGCGLFSVSANTQTSILNPIKLRVLQTQYEKLAARYQEKCKSTKYETEIKLLQIQQGAGLAGGVIFPMTIVIVDVLRSLQKQATDDMCERATDYADLAKVIGDILEENNTNSR